MNKTTISEKEKNFISTVIYVHNNENEIADFLRLLTDWLNRRFEGYEVICVNDASTDCTVKAIEKFSQNIRGGGKKVINILNMGFYQGMELSMNAGMDLAIGDFVYEFDTVAYSCQEEILEAVYARCLEGYDIVSASPVNVSHFLSNQFYTIYNRYSGAQYKLKTETFRILSRRAINRVCSMSNVLPYRKAVYANCGLKMDVILYKTATKPSRGDAEKSMQLHVAEDALILYTNLAYKMSVSVALLMMFATIFVSIYALVIRLQGIPVEGWTTTILFVSFGFFCISFILLIILKYVELILKTVFMHQKYVVESVEKINGEQ